MLLLLADEDFNNSILRGLLRQAPELDIQRVQDVGLGGAPDADILAWAAEEERVLMTHDTQTMPAHVARRIEAGQPVAGVIIVRQQPAIGPVIEQLLIVAFCTTADELRDQIIYIPW